MIADDHTHRHFASLEIGAHAPLAAWPAADMTAPAPSPADDDATSEDAASIDDAATPNDAPTPVGAASTDDAATPSDPTPPHAEVGDQLPRAEPPSPYGWTDVLTGTAGPLAWDRLVAAEQARNARHGRTATIALAEISGFDAAAASWGRDLATHLFVRLGRVLASGIRSSDHIARIGPTRFGVLLTETDEILAINFVDRVRALCRAEVDPASNVVRLVLGWASPPAGGRLADAHALAEERLAEALRTEG